MNPRTNSIPTSNLRNANNNFTQSRDAGAEGFIARKNCHLSKGGKNNFKITVSHLNCRGISTEEGLVEFENSLSNLRYGIIGLSETKKRGEGLLKRKNGNLFYYIGESPYRGVGFYIIRN